jgi:hypothetical protein
VYGTANGLSGKTNRDATIASRTSQPTSNLDSSDLVILLHHKQETTEVPFEAWRYVSNEQAQKLADGFGAGGFPRLLSVVSQLQRNDNLPAVVGDHIKASIRFWMDRQPFDRDERYAEFRRVNRRVWREQDLPIPVRLDDCPCGSAMHVDFCRCSLNDVDAPTPTATFEIKICPRTSKSVIRGKGSSYLFRDGVEIGKLSYHWERPADEADNPPTTEVLNFNVVTLEMHLKRRGYGTLLVNVTRCEVAPHAQVHVDCPITEDGKAWAAAMQHRFDWIPGDGHPEARQPVTS